MHWLAQAVVLGSANQANQQQEHDRANSGAHYGAQNTLRIHDAELPEQPTPDHRAENSNDDIPDYAKAVAFDDYSGQPSCDCADKQPNENPFKRHLVTPIDFDLLTALARNRSHNTPCAAGTARRQSCSHASQWRLPPEQLPI